MIRSSKNDNGFKAPAPRTSLLGKISQGFCCSICCRMITSCARKKNMLTDMLFMCRTGQACSAEATGEGRASKYTW